MFTDFISKKPREQSGARSANRFDYQLSWAFCLLLDLEAGKGDYLVVLDYHDDVVVFDSESSPTCADFYQVKSDTKNKWTLTRLLELAKGSKLSILGKLYAHRVSFGNQARHLTFVSNQGFKLKTVGAKEPVDSDGCTLADLCAEALKDVSSKLQAEHNLSVVPSIGVEMILRRDEWLPVTGHQTLAEGRLSRFLASRFGDRPYSTSHAFRALMDVLRQRNNCEDAVSSVADLTKKKGIGHNEFSGLLARIAANHDSNKWSTIESLLTHEGMTFARLTRLKAVWSAREVQLLDLANSAVQESQEQADLTIKELDMQSPDSPLLDWLSKGLATCKAKLRPLGVPYSDEQITGMLLSALTKIQP
jgi:hypothetical protein